MILVGSIRAVYYAVVTTSFVVLTLVAWAYALWVFLDGSAALEAALGAARAAALDAVETGAYAFGKGFAMERVSLGGTQSLLNMMLGAAQSFGGPFSGSFGGSALWGLEVPALDNGEIFETRLV